MVVVENDKLQSGLKQTLREKASLESTVSVTGCVCSLNRASNSNGEFCNDFGLFSAMNVRCSAENVAVKRKETLLSLHTKV